VRPDDPQAPDREGPCGGERRQHRFARGSVASAFGAVLRELRTARGLSQQRLAEVADLHMTYLSLLERAHRTPTLTAIVKLSDALGVTAEYFVKRTEERLPLSVKSDQSSPEKHS